MTLSLILVKILLWHGIHSGLPSLCAHRLRRSSSSILGLLIIPAEIVAYQALSTVWKQAALVLKCWSDDFISLNIEFTIRIHDGFTMDSYSMGAQSHDANLEVDGTGPLAASTTVMAMLHNLGCLFPCHQLRHRLAIHRTSAE